MGIDHRVLERYGGKSGDPRERAAMMDAQRATHTPRETNLLGLILRIRWYYKLICFITSIILVGIVLYWLK